MFIDSGVVGIYTPSPARFLGPPSSQIPFEMEMFPIPIPDPIPKRSSRYPIPPVRSNSHPVSPSHQQSSLNLPLKIFPVIDFGNASKNTTSIIETL